MATSRTPSTLLGLALDGSRLEAVLVRRTNGSMQVLKTFTAQLALNPVNGAPDLVGREIRNHLDQAGIRERRCTLCLPLGWALTASAAIPEIPEEDIPSFLEIEAERGFPYSPDALAMATSRCRPPSGGQHAMIIAAPRHPLEQLDAALRAAQLRPLSFSFGPMALQDPARDASHGVVAVIPGENAVDLQITCHGGIVALRSIEDAVETEGVQRRLDAAALARELRVTLGQLPEPLRAPLRVLRVLGSSDAARRLAQDLVARVAPLGLTVEPVRAYASDEFRSKPPADTPISAAFSIAARRLTGAAGPFEFLPPRISALQQLIARFSSRRLGWVGGALGAAAAVILGAILYQQWELSQLRGRWDAMAPEVTQLEEMQGLIRRYRPWFDESFRSLSILRRVTEAFPETGTVTARTIEIRDSSAVTCSGTARDNQSFLRMLDQLRASREVGNVKVDQLRGKAPLQFTLNFQWGQGGAGDN